MRFKSAASVPLATLLERAGGVPGADASLVGVSGGPHPPSLGSSASPASGRGADHSLRVRGSPLRLARYAGEVGEPEARRVRGRPTLHAGAAHGSSPRARSRRTSAGSMRQRSSRRASVGAALAVEAVDARAEDELVLRRVLPADELGHRDLVPVRREAEAAHDVREVRAQLAAVQRVVDERLVGGIARRRGARRAGARPRPGSTARRRRDRRRARWRARARRRSPCRTRAAPSRPGAARAPRRSAMRPATR